MLELIADPTSWIALLTLSVLEIVLGIDNIIFISILVGRLPESLRGRARVVGLALAMVTRIALLFSIVWLTRLTRPWFSLWGEEFSGRDLILIAGGLFLIAKSVTEVHETLEGAANEREARLFSSFAIIVIQIAIIDIVFSLDSVFTAVGLATPDQVPIMVTAIVISILVMMLVSGSISRFVEAHPTVKILALAFLVLVGVALIADGCGTHIPKGYLYFAMAFSVVVEMVNLRLRRLLDRRRTP
ncbi:MAG TPA: TerC family protein [Steroidobacteraceae bacterium]|nr:TerC family protein [Steroidobacteraceae bacterium]